jgi:lipopolysaccharide transport system ATP-binding protein
LCALMQIGSPLSIQVEFRSAHPLRPILGVTIKTVQGTPVFGVSNRWTLAGFDGPQLSEGVISCDFASLPLMPGRYSVDLHFGDFADLTRDLDVVLDATSFEIYPTDVYGTGLLPNAMEGPIIWQASWTARRVE